MRTNDKRATISLEMALWLPRLIFLVLVIVLTSFLIHYFIADNVDTFDVETGLFSGSILFSESISYVHPDTGRLEAGTIDLNKFLSADISKKIDSELGYGSGKRLGAKISLENLETGEKYADVFHKKEFYEEKTVIAEAGYARGAGGARASVKDYYVLIKDADSLEKGLLTISMVMPNS